MRLVPRVEVKRTQAFARTVFSHFVHFPSIGLSLEVFQVVLDVPRDDAVEQELRLVIVQHRVSTEAPLMGDMEELMEGETELGELRLEVEHHVFSNSAMRKWKSTASPIARASPRYKTLRAAQRMSDSLRYWRRERMLVEQRLTYPFGPPLANLNVKKYIQI